MLCCGVYNGNRDLFTWEDAKEKARKKGMRRTSCTFYKQLSWMLLLCVPCRSSEGSGFRPVEQECFCITHHSRIAAQWHHTQRKIPGEKWSTNSAWIMRRWSVHIARLPYSYWSLCPCDHGLIFVDELLWGRQHRRTTAAEAAEAARARATTKTQQRNNNDTTTAVVVMNSYRKQNQQRQQRKQHSN